ncbi:TPA: hypothetical protein ACS5XR_005422, partial [Salmonella enterica]
GAGSVTGVDADDRVTVASDDAVCGVTVSGPAVTGSDPGPAAEVGSGAGMFSVVPCDGAGVVDVDVDDGRLGSSAKAFRSSGDAGEPSVTAAADGSGGNTGVSPVTLPGDTAAGVVVSPDCIISSYAL